MTKILIVGASGFIGNNLLEVFSKTQHQIIATYKTKIPNIKKYPNIKWIKLNLNLKKKYNLSNFDNAEILIHLAWGNLSDYLTSKHLTKELPSHYFFIKNLILDGLQNIIITGTCFEYGLREGELSEKMKNIPYTNYAKAKDQLRKKIFILQEKYKFNFTWARIFYLYGKDQFSNSLWNQLNNAAKNKKKYFYMSFGQQVRDFINVQKLVIYLKKISLINKNCGIINICSGKPITVEKIVKKWIKKNNIKITIVLGKFPYNKYEPMNFWGNKTKLKRILGDKN